MNFQKSNYLFKTINKMDKTYLLKTAKEISQVQVSAFKEYNDKAEHIIQEMNNKMLARTDIIDLVGEKNISMMKDNHSNHVRFIASILKNYNPEVFVDTVLWVFRAYRSRNFHTNYWAALLNTFMELLKIELSKQSYKEIFPYYEWMQINIPVFVKLSGEELEKVNSKQ